MCVLRRDTRENYDRHGARPLPGLQPGDTMRVKVPREHGWNTSGVVKDKANMPRDPTSLRPLKVPSGTTGAT